ncbi:MAG: hypothetical protein V3R93_05610, partial [Candidatus Hydrothermarchaeaceae archaeon]
QITKKLPPSLAFPPLPPGFEWPAIIEIPPGTEIPDWWIHTEDWLPGDEFPPGATIPPDVDIPLWFLYSILFPPGTIIPPGFVLPPGWQPGDPLPPGVIPPGVLPGDAGDPSTCPPLYIPPGEPGPVRPSFCSYPLTKTSVSITSTNSDGVLQRCNTTWSATRDGTPANDIDTGGALFGPAIMSIDYGASMCISRSFFYFNLSSISSSAGIVSCGFSFYGALETGSAEAIASVQEGTQGDPLQKADFQSFTGAVFDTISMHDWVVDTYFPHNFVLNSTGLEYIKSKFGGTALLCVREWLFDFRDISVTEPKHAAFMYSERSVEAERPILNITYEI